MSYILKYHAGRYFSSQITLYGLHFYGSGGILFNIMRKQPFIPASALSFSFTVFLWCILPGCGETETGKVPPPLLKVDLSLRMLENSRSGDHQAALSQCRKLSELGTPAMGFRLLEHNINYNSVIDSAQQELDKGNAGKALEILNAARGRFGSSQVFLEYIAQVEFLVNAEKHLLAMRNAVSLEDKRNALNVVLKDCAGNDSLREVLAPELEGVRSWIAAEEERIRAAAEAAAQETAVDAAKGIER
jgi:hypothetical protein